MRHLEKSILIQILDNLWKEHLLNMDHLKEGIHLRGYAQKDPLNEYKREAYDLYNDLRERVRSETIEVLARVEVTRPEEMEALEMERAAARDRLLAMNHPESGSWSDGLEQKMEGSKVPYRREEAKIGRNSPCPCESGRKYKHCHGRLNG